MKINVVYIGLAFCLAGCGGGGGSNAVGAPVLSPAPIEFSDGSTLLGEDTMRVEINGVLRTLAGRIGKIIWRSTQASMKLIWRVVIRIMLRLQVATTINHLPRFWVILNP